VALPGVAVVVAVHGVDTALLGNALLVGWRLQAGGGFTPSHVVRGVRARGEGWVLMIVHGVSTVSAENQSIVITRADKQPVWCQHCVSCLWAVKSNVIIYIAPYLSTAYQRLTVCQDPSHFRLPSGQTDNPQTLSPADRASGSSIPA
jgi:hypothetical protein